MSSQVFYTEEQLLDLHSRRDGALAPEAYSMRSPVPQALLVTGRQDAPAGVCVRTTTITPLSWVPYTMAVTIPDSDQKVLTRLAGEQPEVVLALPTRDMLRETVVCAQLLPEGVPEADVARLRLFRSQYVAAPSIDNCPVNFECRVLHVEPYHGSQVLFLRVVGASIDPSLLFADRKTITGLFPTNYVDDITGEDGIARRRVGLMGELFLCPTFPVAPKQGWYATFEIWMKDLMDEEFINRSEYEKVTGWSARWAACFDDLEHSDRTQLRKDLTHVLRLVVHEDWDALHQFLA